MKRISTIKMRLVLLTILICSMSSSVFSQGATYTLDTLRNKKWSYQAVVHAGAFIDAEGSNFNPTTAGAFVYARYHFMKRLTFAALGGMLPIKVGNADLSKALLAEGRVSINFKKKLEVGKEHFKLGSDGTYKYSADVNINSGTLYGLTGSFGINRRLHTENKDSSSSWKMKDKAQKDVFIPNVSTQVTVTQFSVGIFMSRAVNFKGRFKLSTGRTMIRRKRSNMDFAFEALIAPSIKVETTPTLINKIGDADTVNQFSLYDIKYKRLGWRMQANLRKGIISYYMEMGGRPGVYFNLLDAKSEDNKWYLAPFNGFYLRMGIGIGIGFINQDK